MIDARDVNVDAYVLQICSGHGDEEGLQAKRRILVEKQPTGEFLRRFSRQGSHRAPRESVHHVLVYRPATSEGQVCIVEACHEFTTVERAFVERSLIRDFLPFFRLVTQIRAPKHHDLHS